MSAIDPSAATIPYRVDDLGRRVSRLEELKPEVVAYEVSSLRDEVHGLKRAFYTFAFSVVGSAVVFAFSVFALIGNH